MASGLLQPAPAPRLRMGVITPPARLPVGPPRYGHEYDRPDEVVGLSPPPGAASPGQRVPGAPVGTGADNSLVDQLSNRVLQGMLMKALPGERLEVAFTDSISKLRMVAVVVSGGNGTYTRIESIRPIAVEGVPYDQLQEHHRARLRAEQFEAEAAMFNLQRNAQWTAAATNDPQFKSEAQRQYEADLAKAAQALQAYEYNENANPLRLQRLRADLNAAAQTYTLTGLKIEDLGLDIGTKRALQPSTIQKGQAEAASAVATAASNTVKALKDLLSVGATSPALLAQLGISMEDLGTLQEQVDLEKDQLRGHAGKALGEGGLLTLPRRIALIEQHYEDGLLTPGAAVGALNNLLVQIERGVSGESLEVSNRQQRQDDAVLVRQTVERLDAIDKDTTAGVGALVTGAISRASQSRRGMGRRIAAVTTPDIARLVDAGERRTENVLANAVVAATTPEGRASLQQLYGEYTGRTPVRRGEPSPGPPVPPRLAPGPTPAPPATEQVQEEEQVRRTSDEPITPEQLEAISQAVINPEQRRRLTELLRRESPEAFARYLESLTMQPKSDVVQWEPPGEETGPEGRPRVLSIAGQAVDPWVVDRANARTPSPQAVAAATAPAQVGGGTPMAALGPPQAVGTVGPYTPDTSERDRWESLVRAQVVREAAEEENLTLGRYLGSRGTHAHPTRSRR